MAVATEKVPKVIIGFADNGNAYCIEDRIHIAEFGEVGSGKSETLKLLALQNIKNNDGFLFIDPHGMAARDILGMIPKERWDDVIYINPSSINKYGKTIRINPLEVKNEDERYIIAMSFVNALHNLHRESWGDRLEAILRNAANALVEIEASTLRDLRMLISDDRVRTLLLGKVTSKDTIHFFKNTYEKQYSKEAGSAAYNKLDKILATPPIAAMLDAPKSSIDFAEILDSGKIVIVDLSTGASDDVSSFLGSIILHMFYVEATKRIEKRESALKNPYYVYIDEAHRFSAFALREILNTMRKFNVKVTIATQTINAYPKRVADEISALCRTIICFKCDNNTAVEFKNLLPVTVEELTGMSMRTFAFYSQGLNPNTGVAKTRKIPSPYNWEDLAKYSVQKHGEAVSMSKYMPVIKATGEYPEIIPCESIILHCIKNENAALTREELFDTMSQKFDSPDDQTRRLVFESVENLARLRHLDRVIDKDSKGIKTRFKLTNLAVNTFFSTTAMGRRAGSTLHLAAIFSLAKIMQQQQKHCIVDLGDKGEQRPDLLVFEPNTFKDSNERTRYDLENWSEKIIAVEVETDPTKHENQIIINFEKNRAKGYEVWFAVFSENHKQYIIDSLTKKEIAPQDYSIFILNNDYVLATYEKYDSPSSTSISELEAQVLSILGQGPATPDKIISNLPISAATLLEVLRSLEGKKLVDNSTIDIVKQTTDFKNDRILKRHKTQMVAEVTEQGKSIVDNDEIQPDLSQTETNQNFLNYSEAILKKMFVDESVSKVEKDQIQIVLESRGYRISESDGKLRIRKK